MFPSANIIPYNGNTWWFLFFVVLLGTSSLNYFQKANSQQASDLAHSFAHFRIFPQLSVCSYTVVFSEFSGKLLLWNTKTCVYLVAHWSGVHLKQHILLCGSGVSMPWFLRETANFPVVFGICITSRWILRGWEIHNECSKGWVSFCIWPPEYWVGVLL